MPAARADAMPASVSSKTVTSRRVDAEELERLQVALGIGLPLDDVVGADDAPQERREARRLDDRLDLGARGAGADRERHALGGVADGLARVLVHRRAVGDGGAVALDALGDHRVDVGVVAPEPGADDLGVGEACELVEVLLRRQRLAVLGEEVG